MLAMNNILNTYKTPNEIQHIIADNVRVRRKRLHLTQEEFARKCDVSFGSYKRFETTGEISLASLVKICKILGADDQFVELFVKTEYTSIDEVINARKR